jgi:hypothetical protein
MGFIADYNSRFAHAPSSAHDAHRPLRAHEKLDEVFRWKESRVMSMNLTIHYNRYLYLVEPSPEALQRRGKEVEVHETFDGRVLLRVDGLDLRTVPFNPEGGVRQQDIDDNKYLATTLAKIRQDQLRPRRREAHPAQDAAGEAQARGLPRRPPVGPRTRHFYLGPNPTFLLWFDIAVSLAVTRSAPVTTTVEGRNRFTVNARYAEGQRLRRSACSGCPYG